MLAGQLAYYRHLIADVLTTVTATDDGSGSGAASSTSPHWAEGTARERLREVMGRMDAIKAKLEG